MTRTATPTAAQALAACGAIILFGSRSASAADLLVPRDYPTIQAAIDAAVHGDRVLLADGVYAGPGNVDLDFGGRLIVVEGANGAEQCTIDGSSTPGSHAFVFDSGEHAAARVIGVTIAGFATSAGDEGAIRIIGSGPSIRNCRFVNCTTLGPTGATTPGSCVALIDSSPDVQDSLFAFNEGSAVFTDADSVVYLISCTFEDNVTRPADGRGGGAVYNEGFTLTFTSFYLRNRVEAVSGPARGGAFASGGGMLDLTTATFEANEVNGPSVRQGAAVFTAGPFVVNSGIILDHHGDHAGGAIYVEGAGLEAGFSAPTTAIYENNTVGGIQINDPNAVLEVRIGSSYFCGNTPYDIEGPFVDWSANTVCCPADLDGSSDIGPTDLAAVLAAWGQCTGCPADLNGDDVVNAADLSLLLGSWGACPELPDSP